MAGDATIFDGEVRLFPLSDVVMFPNSIVPLHIFESRYREMLEDAVGDDELIAIATLLPGHEHDYYTRAPISPAICIGRVTRYQQNDNGTYDLLLQGLQRAEVLQEVEPVRSFRRATAKLIPESSSNEDAVAAENGVRLADRLRQVAPAAEQLVVAFEEGVISTPVLTDMTAFHLPLPTDLKLELLAEGDAELRATRLLASLPSGFIRAMWPLWLIKYSASSGDA